MSHEVKPFADAERAGACERAVRHLASTLVLDGVSPAAAASTTIAEYVVRPGKRVRPYLCALAAELTTRTRQGRADRWHAGVLEFSAALELLHSFLLVHDDVADRADLRRGSPALHVLLRPEPGAFLTEGDRQRIGNDLAVVAGDRLYTVAMQAMLTAPGLAPEHRLAAMSEVLDVCRGTADGQFDDVAFGARPLHAVRPEDVLEIYRLKTARYTFEGPLVAGALLAGASPRVVAALRTYGTAAGIAFQLEDDLLALFASEDATGKPNLADLREGKKTWPILTAWARASDQERAWLDELFVRGDASSRDLARVRVLVRRTGTLADARKVIEDACETATHALYDLEHGPETQELAAILGWLRARAGSLQ